MDFGRLKITCIAILGLLVTGNACFGADSVKDWIKLSGFGTLGLTYGGEEGFGFRRDISREGKARDSWSFETDSLLGVQVDAQLAPPLSATVQLVVKDRTENGLEESLEWAFLRYRLNSELTIRAGRLGVESFMLSDYRNVGFAYLWARPPVEFYGPIAYGYVDGADVVYSRPWGAGVFRAKLFGGKNEEVFAGTLTDDFSIDLTSFGTSLSWESDRWQARLGLVAATIDNSLSNTKPLVDALHAVPAFLWPEAGGLADSLDSKDKDARYYSLGIRYDDHPWVVQVEGSYLDSDLKGTLPLSSGYVSVGRRIGPVTIFGMAAKAKNPDGRRLASQAPLPAFYPLQQGIQSVYDTTYIDQQSLSCGLRWDIRHDLALKAQWDHHWIEPYGGGLWAQERPFAEERELDTFSINLNFVF